MDKKTLRANNRKLRNELSEETRKREEERTIQAIFSTMQYENAKTILCYVSYGSEFDTISIIKNSLLSGKEVFVPKVISEHEMDFFRIDCLEDLEPGAYGILEPVDGLSKYEYDPSKNTIMLLPGLAFDRAGNRLGYGKGYYDTYLNSIQKQVKFNKNSFCLFGVMYTCQLVERVPSEEHDRKLDFLCVNGDIVKTNQLS